MRPEENRNFRSRFRVEAFYLSLSRSLFSPNFKLTNFRKKKKQAKTMQMKKGMIRILIPILDQSLRMHDILLHVQLTKKCNENKFRIKRINSYHQNFSRVFPFKCVYRIIKDELVPFIHYTPPHNDYLECCLYHTKKKKLFLLLCRSRVLSS